VIIALLFGHFLFRNWRRKIVFLMLTCTMAIFANILRVCLLIFAAHLGFAELVLDIDDHRLLGNIVFIAVIGAVCAVGLRFSDRDREHLRQSRFSNADHGIEMKWGFVASSVAAIFLMATLSPIGVAVARSHLSSQTISTPAALPTVGRDWHGPTADESDWWPAVFGADHSLTGHYVHEGAGVDVHFYYYGPQADGGELISDLNSVYVSTHWTRVWVQHRSTALPSGQRWRYVETEIKSQNDSNRRIVRHWFCVNTLSTSRAGIGKLLEAKSLISGRPAAGSLLILSTPVTGGPNEARRRLDRLYGEFEWTSPGCLNGFSDSSDQLGAMS
jgi:EpsI family protein